MATTTTTTVLETSVTLTPVADEEPLYTIDELIRRRAAELGDNVMFGAPKQSTVDFEEHSARTVDKYIDAAVVKLQELDLRPVEASDKKAPVVGMLAHSGIPYVVTIVALNRLGYTSFLVSPRLASPALKQLLDLADCHTLLTTESFHRVIGEVQKERDVIVKPMLVREDYDTKNAPVFRRQYDQAAEAKKVAVIIHSSGSTGLPKPIYLTNQSCIAAFAIHMDMRGFIAAPMFHSNCFYETFRAIYSRKPLYYCNFAIPLTRQNLIDMVDAVKPEIFHVVPYTIKLLAESDAGIDMLARMKLVLFSGSACPDALGKRLVERGVNLVANYGATETGRVMNSARPQGDKDWDYLRLLPSAVPYILMDEIAPGSGLYECVALDGLKSKSTVNTDDPPGAFRTRDLFTPHPTRPGLWKYASRMDDRFTLINGEKVLPLPIEGRIRQEELVREACVFGERHSFPGVLIVRADCAASMSDEIFLDSVWTAVEAANSNAETFSRIPRDFVIVLPANTQYPQTDKGTFIRMQMYEQFKEEIESAYRGYETVEEGNLVLEGEALENYLLQKLRDYTGGEVPSAEADLFASGIDSLQCMQMWHLLKRELDLGGHQNELSQNVLYETGNVRQLAAYLTGLRKGEGKEKADDVAIMEELIAKYSNFKRQEVVLLTGATGALGAHLLVQLVARPNVSAVWTTVRASNDNAALLRVRKSLDARGLRLSDEQFSKVVAVSTDLGRPDLGLAPSKLAELSKVLTCVVHGAWAVNFNIPVQSFEDQHIGAVHNLIQICLSTRSSQPARFYFCSSVSSAGGSPRPGTVPEGPVVSPKHVQGTGYARSKYVAEQITLNAARSCSNLTARVLRVGQLVGDTKVGEWNTTEGIPLMIQTAQTIGALPALDEEMTWLPVDVAATAIIELAGLIDAQTTAPIDRVFHVLNPTRFHWTREMLPALASAGLDFETLPTDQWMDRLRKSDLDPVKNPPIKLLNWFESKYGSKEGAAKIEVLLYSTEETIRASPALDAVPDVLNKEYVSRFVDRLRGHWEGR